MGESTFIQAWENMLLREKGESLAEAKEKERLELMEEKRRKRAAKLGAIRSQIDLEQNLERVEREDMWREDRRSMKVEVNNRQRILREMNRELEIMRVEDAISRDYHNKLIEIKEKEELKMKFNLHLRKIKEEKEIEELRLMKLGLNRDASKKRRNAPSAMPNGNNVERQITNEVDDDTKRLYH